MLAMPGLMTRLVSPRKPLQHGRLRMTESISQSRSSNGSEGARFATVHAIRQQGAVAERDVRSENYTQYAYTSEAKVRWQNVM